MSVGNTKTVEVKTREWTKDRVRTILSPIVPLARMVSSNLGATSIVQKIDDAAKPEYQGLLTDAVNELAAIMSNKDNPFGYHLNHITSGKKVYSVICMDGDEAGDISDETFYSREEAEKEKAKHRGSFVQEYYTDEWFAVLNENNKNIYSTAYANRTDALARLYFEKKPPKFVKYFEGNPITGMQLERSDENEEEQD